MLLAGEKNESQIHGIIFDLDYLLIDLQWSVNSIYKLWSFLFGQHFSLTLTTENNKSFVWTPGVFIHHELYGSLTKTWLMQAVSRKKLWSPNSTLKPCSFRNWLASKNVTSEKCWNAGGKQVISKGSIFQQEYKAHGSKAAGTEMNLPKMTDLLVTKIHHRYNYFSEHFHPHFIGWPVIQPRMVFLVEKQCFCQLKSQLGFFAKPNKSFEPTAVILSIRQGWDPDLIINIA